MPETTAETATGTAVADTTEKPLLDTDTDTEQDAIGGCGAALAFASTVLPAMAAAVILRKKD